MSYPFANVNIGTNTGDGTGDPLRTAFNTINNNFANIASGNVTINAPVQSVAGRTGNVVLTVNDITGAASTGNVTTQINAATSTIANATVANYLPSYSGNIGNITVTGTTGLANLTQAQVAAISGPTNGMMVYNYTFGNVQVWTSRLNKWGNLLLS